MIITDYLVALVINLSLGKAYGSQRSLLEWLSLCKLQPWGKFRWLTVIRRRVWIIDWCYMCKCNGESVFFFFWRNIMMNQLITYICISLLLHICGPWYCVCLECIGWFQNLLLSYYLAGNVSFIAIGMVIYGWISPIVWCGAFGGKEIAGALKI